MTDRLDVEQRRNEGGTGAMHSHARLIGFLGKANYTTTTYEWDGYQVESRFSPHAIARLLGERGETLREVTVICTKEAWDLHRIELTECLRNDTGLEPHVREIPRGSNPDELWQMFRVLCDEFRGDATAHLVVDITLGFRSQPFFAAAVLAFVRATTEPLPPLRVLYAGDLASGQPTKVWEITRAIEVVDWAHALQLFLKTGRAGPVAQLAKSRGHDLARQWAKDRNGPRPALDELGRAIQQFGEDLATLRTGDLLLGREGSRSSAHRLLDAIQRAKPAVEAHLPPLAEILERLERMAEPLDVDDLQSERGRRGLAALAQIYVEMERHVEAATTIREAWVTLYADPSATRPGTGFDQKKREQAERTCRQVLGERRYDEFGQLRNDLNHAGMNHDPRSSRRIVDAVKREVEHFKQIVHQGTLPSSFTAAAAGPPVFLNVSNHPSSSWAPEQVQAALELVGPGGRLEDIPFPLMDPARLDRIYLEELAEAILQQMDRLQGIVTHAMVQGEHTLTTLLVARLQARGIRCYAATTDRVVDETALDGVKMSRFTFRGFREYPAVGR